MNDLLRSEGHTEDSLANKNTNVRINGYSFVT